MGRSFFGRLHALYRELGAWESVSYLLTRLGVFRYVDMEIHQIVARDVATSPPASQGEDSVREAGLADLALLSRLGVEPRTATTFLGRGYRLWLLEEHGEPLALDWLAGPEKPLWGFLDLVGGEGDIWHWHYQVAQHARGRGLGGRIRGYVATCCDAEGYRRLLGNYKPRNKASKRVLDKLGYRPLGRLFYLRLGRFRAVLFRRRLFLGRWSQLRRLRIAMPAREDTSPDGSDGRDGALDSGRGWPGTGSSAQG